MRDDDKPIFPGFSDSEHPPVSNCNTTGVHRDDISFCPWSDRNGVALPKVNDVMEFHTYCNLYVTEVFINKIVM